MARITASLYTSHIPAVGAAFDLGKTKEDYWKPVFAGYDFDKQWMKTHKPDVIVAVYNDHATAFSLAMIPTFAIMTGPRIRSRGRGLRRAPGAEGHRRPRACLAYRLGGDPAGFRPDHRQRDRRRSRPHRAALLRLRQGQGMAVQDHSLRGQRGAAPRALGRALLRARAGDRPRRS